MPNINYFVFNVGLFKATALALFFGSVSINAQNRTTVFNYITDEIIIDSLSNLPQVVGITNTDLFEEIYFVNISRPEEIQDDGLIDINLIDSLGNMDTFTIQTKFYEPTDTLTEFYFGKIIESDTLNHLEYSYLLNEGRHSAEINFNNRFYRLVSISGDTCYLGKRIQRDSTFCGVPEIQDTTAMLEYIRSLPSYDTLYKNTFDTVCVIRVMALYPTMFLAPNSVATLNGITDEVIMGINQMNQAVRNSGISRSFRFEFAGIRQHEGITPQDQTLFGTALDLLRLWNNLPLTADYREDFEADLIVFISLNLFAADLAGLAIESGMPPDPDLASILLWPNQVNADYSLVHELAHVMGCHHQICDIDDSNGCVFENMGIQHAYSVGGSLLRDVKTVVHTGTKRKRRILQFSNPRKSYTHIFKPRKLGIAGEADNARIIQSNACTVAAFHPDGVTPPNKQIYISGPDQPCPCGFFNLFGKAIGFDPSHSLSYQWAHSSDGFNYTNINLAVFPDLNFSTSCVSGEIDFYRLEVTNNTTSEVLFGYHTIIVGPINLCDQGPIWKMQLLVSSSENNNAFRNANIEVKLFPNPASNTLNLMIGNLDKTTFFKVAEINVNIINSIGVIHHKQTFKTSFGKNKLMHTIMLNDMDSGIYFVRIDIGAQSFINPIIIQQ